MKKRAWLMLMYSLPARSSTDRVYVWRKLKNAGVLYLQHSVCLLPDSVEHKKTLANIQTAILSRKGEARVSVIGFGSAHEETDLIRRFQSQAEEEYGEFLGICRNFHAELDKERKNQHFTFAELEENEAELDKLRAWLPKIGARDFFPAKPRLQASSALEKCSEDLRRYSSEVSRRQA
jgi:hypothetical protein